MPRTQWRHLQCPSSARPHRHVPLRLGLRVWGRGGGAQRAPAPPHAPLPLAPATTAFLPAVDLMARILRSHLGGLCGVMGGGSPPLGRLLARCLPPLALDRSASAGRRSSAALGLPRGRQAPPHALRASGLAPNPASPRVPRLSCLVLSPSRLLTSVVSLARLAPRFLSEPLPSALGGRGRRVPGARVGDPGG